MDDLKSIIGKVATGASLSREEAASAFDAMMSGEATPSQMGGLLMALRVRGETVDEITGAASAPAATAPARSTSRPAPPSSCQGPAPPVPTMSTASGGAVTVSILERIADTAPVISSTVSPRTLSAINRPPICEGVASPLIMASKAEAASSRDRLAPVSYTHLTLPTIYSV